jgi:hypothetical protein
MSLVDALMINMGVVAGLKEVQNLLHASCSGQITEMDVSSRFFCITGCLEFHS